MEDGSLIEIKGFWTKLVDIKTNSVIDRQIKVLYRNDLDYAFNYVEENYDYVNLWDLYE